MSDSRTESRERARRGSRDRGNKECVAEETTNRRQWFFLIVGRKIVIASRSTLIVQPWDFVGQISHFPIKFIEFIGFLFLTCPVNLVPGDIIILIWIEGYYKLVANDKYLNILRSCKVAEITTRNGRMRDVGNKECITEERANRQQWLFFDVINQGSRRIFFINSFMYP